MFNHGIIELEGIINMLLCFLFEVVAVRQRTCAEQILGAMLEEIFATILTTIPILQVYTWSINNIPQKTNNINVTTC